MDEHDLPRKYREPRGDRWIAGVIGIGVIGIGVIFWALVLWLVLR
jgi:hypothetical protein